MFVKHGDGKIISVIPDEDELTDDQKKNFKRISQTIKKDNSSEDETKGS